MPATYENKVRSKLKLPLVTICSQVKNHVRTSGEDSAFSSRSVLSIEKGSCDIETITSNRALDGFRRVEGGFLPNTEKILPIWTLWCDQS